MDFTLGLETGATPKKHSRAPEVRKNTLIDFDAAPSTTLGAAHYIVSESRQPITYAYVKDIGYEANNNHVDGSKQMHGLGAFADIPALTSQARDGMCSKG